MLSPAGLAPDRRRNVRAAVSGALALVSLVLLENLAGPLLNQMVLRFPGIDKALHFVQFAIVFAILAYLLKLAGYDDRRRYALAFAGGLLVAAVDETAQMWGPGRNVELADLAADAAGVAFACSLLAARGGNRATVAAAALAAGVWVTYHSHVATRDFAQGLRYERQHDFAQARVHYARALARGVRSPGLYNSLGWVEVEGNGDAARAVEYAATALSMRPNDPDILDTYGWALHHAGRSAEALAPLEK
ncbi:MAG TPA: VanZ family protein, partial [Vicinamibacterales bacterium]|nr:VanZ family protein [Vicinamibacterales bacterium]